MSGLKRLLQEAMFLRSSPDAEEMLDVDDQLTAVAKDLGLQSGPTSPLQSPPPPDASAASPEPVDAPSQPLQQPAAAEPDDRLVPPAQRALLQTPPLEREQQESANVPAVPIEIPRPAGVSPGQRRVRSDSTSSESSMSMSSTDDALGRRSTGAAAPAPAPAPAAPAARADVAVTVPAPLLVRSNSTGSAREAVTVPTPSVTNPPDGSPPSEMLGSSGSSLSLLESQNTVVCGSPTSRNLDRNRKAMAEIAAGIANRRAHKADGAAATEATPSRDQKPASKPAADPPEPESTGRPKGATSRTDHARTVTGFVVPSGVDEHAAAPAAEAAPAAAPTSPNPTATLAVQATPSPAARLPTKGLSSPNTLSPNVSAGAKTPTPATTPVPSGSALSTPATSDGAPTPASRVRTRVTNEAGTPDMMRRSNFMRARSHTLESSNTSALPPLPAEHSAANFVFLLTNHLPFFSDRARPLQAQEETTSPEQVFLSRKRERERERERERLGL